MGDDYIMVTPLEACSCGLLVLGSKEVLPYFGDSTRVPQRMGTHHYFAFRLSWLLALPATQRNVPSPVACDLSWT